MHISVTRDRTGKMRHVVQVRQHTFAVDEGPANGGEDSGPTPHDLYDAALAACKALTVLWYANRKRMPVEDIEVTIVRLREYGYLDDARYAGVVARSFPTLGRQGLAHQMTKRGIASEHWQMFIDQIDAGEEYERALAVALKHSPPVTLMTIPQEKWQRRLAGYLGRRGFSSSTSLAVCRELHRRAEDLKEAEECE